MPFSFVPDTTIEANNKPAAHKLSLVALRALTIAALLANQALPAAVVAPPLPPRFNAWKTTILTAAAEAITIQNPATHRHVIFKAATVYCSAVCTFHVEIAGTAATTTTLAVNSVSRTRTSLAAAFSASNAGVGTITTPDITVSAGVNQPIDLTGFELLATNDNLTIRTNSITGTVQILVVWEEY